MNDIIVVEGPDCSGKDTFIEMYCKEHDINNYTTFKNGLYESKEKAYEAYFNQLSAAMTIRERFNTPVFINRTFISDIVYGDAYRGGDRISDSKCEDLLSCYNAAGVKFVFMQRSIGEALECWRPKNKLGIEYITDEESYLEVYHTYERISKRSEYGAYLREMTIERRDIFCLDKIGG